MDNKEFQYTYSAKDQTEVEAIRKKYLPQQQSKLEQLRMLDRTPSKKARTCALSLGIIGSLVMGSGMSLFMSELGAALKLPGTWALIIGLIAGIAGMALIALAYPVYNRVLKKQRERIAPEILRLTEELMQ